jgi:hypothetical protein
MFYVLLDVFGRLKAVGRKPTWTNHAGMKLTVPSSRVVLGGHCFKGSIWVSLCITSALPNLVTLLQKRGGIQGK